MAQQDLFMQMFRPGLVNYQTRPKVSAQASAPAAPQPVAAQNLFSRISAGIGLDLGNAPE